MAHVQSWNINYDRCYVADYFESLTIGKCALRGRSQLQNPCTIFPTSINFFSTGPGWNFDWTFAPLTVLIVVEKYIFNSILVVVHQKNYFECCVQKLLFTILTVVHKKIQFSLLCTKKVLKFEYCAQKIFFTILIVVHRKNFSLPA